LPVVKVGTIAKKCNNGIDFSVEGKTMKQFICVENRTLGRQIAYLRAVVNP